MEMRGMLRFMMLALAAASLPVAAAEEGYTVADFARVPKIDTHLHLHGPSQEAFLALARKDNFRALTINVDYPDFPPLDVQRKAARAAAKAYPEQIAWVATFGTRGFEQPGWVAATLKDLDGAIAAGAVGVKVWKNIGMDLRDAQGRLVMVDDPRLAGLFSGLEQRGVRVLGHQGEPYDCWLPIEQMTVKNDREYFAHHPAYHMFKHPEMPSYEQQMAARDKLLAQHPRLHFTGVHMASLEWDVDRLGRWLDSHPDASVDVAARIGQIQYQSQRDLQRVRNFFIKYQDRVMYGSDLAQSSGQSDADFVKDVDTVWRRDWRYFNTSDNMTVPELDQPVRGLGLPRAVVDKLYHVNAEKTYPRAWRISKP
jgi:predicted TIM-barrel fold metal-dependent hydrolase